MENEQEQYVIYIAHLIRKVQEREALTAMENQELNDWREKSGYNEEAFRQLMDRKGLMADIRELEQFDTTASIDVVFGRLGLSAKPVIRIRRWLPAAAAAILTLAIAGAAWLVVSRRPPVAVKAPIARHFTNDLPPGSSGATLTLAGGRKIALDSMSNGTLAVQGNEKILYKNGRVSYVNGAAPSGEVAYNTLTTARGRQYQLVLSDGSKVWLNAGSSIRYPQAFTEQERRVEITGEAYFEVSGSAQDPFIVSANGAQVRVLGTHFDVNAYTDETTLNTSLLEGRVRIGKGSDSVLLKPGQQARLDAGGIIRVVELSDPGASVAWKDGYFSFEDADIQTVMRQLSRWYDIEVQYEGGKPPPDHFWGKLSRNEKLSDVLVVLEKSGVMFSIEGNQVTVRSK